MPLFKRSGAGSGYIVLNALRVVNIIALVAGIAASVVMLVKTFVVSKFFFFDAISHVVTAILSSKCTLLLRIQVLKTTAWLTNPSAFLIVTETSLCRKYIAKNWPLFSPSHGLVTLGITMIVVGVSILGNLNKSATSQKSLGTSFWRIVIAGGILLVVLGAVNIAAVSFPPLPSQPPPTQPTNIKTPQNYLFRIPSEGLTARMVRSKGETFEHKLESSASSARSGRKSFHLGRSDTLPSYRTNNNNNRPQVRNISAPVMFAKPSSSSNNNNNNNNVCEEIPRPDLALHPALVGGRI